MVREGRTSGARLLWAMAARSQLLRCMRHWGNARLDIGQFLASVANTRDPQEVLQALAEGLKEVIPHEQVSLGMLSEDQTTLEFTVRGTGFRPCWDGRIFPLEESISSEALNENRTVLQRDLRQEPVLSAERCLLAAGFRSHMVAPLRIGSRWLGTIHLAHRHPGIYSQEHARLLTQIGSPVAMALQHVGEREAWQQQAERLQAMARGLISIGPRPLSEAMAAVLEVAANATGVTQASFFRYDESSHALVLEAVTTSIPGLIERARQTLVFRLGADEGLVGLVAATRQPFYVASCDAEPRWRALRPEIKSAYMTPVVFGDRLYGVIRLLSEAVDAISPEQRSVADTVAAHSGAVLENARLYEEIRTELELGRRRLRALGEAARQLGLEQDSEHALQSLLDLARDLVGARYGALAVRDREGGVSTRVVSVPAPVERGPNGASSLPPRGLGDWIAHSGPGIRRDGLSRRPTPKGVRSEHGPLKDGLCLPIMSKGQRVGAFYLANKQDDAEFSRVDEALLNVFAALSHVFLENLTLYSDVLRERSTLAAIQASMIDGLIVFDSHGQILYFNEVAAGLLDLVAEESLGKPVAEVVQSKASSFRSSGDLEAVLEIMSGRRELPATVEIGLARPRERELVVRAFRIPINPKEWMTGLLVRDATGEHELERRHDAFVSIAAHELRTPMTTILGFSELLLGEDRPESIRREWLEHIHRETARLATIIDDLLNVSRIRSGKLTVNLESVSLPLVLERALDNIGPIPSTHDLLVDIAPDVSGVVADPDKLTEVLMNLLSNAIKYSPRGGRITISATGEPKRRRVVVAVADQGIGISHRDQARLFTPFHRIRHPETEEVRGTGLGLYIAKELVDLMHGEIWVQSEVDKGSTFFLSVPAVGLPEVAASTGQGAKGRGDDAPG